MLAEAGISKDDLEQRKMDSITRFARWAELHSLDTNHEFYAAMCGHLADAVEIGFFGKHHAELAEEG